MTMNDEEKIDLADGIPINEKYAGADSPEEDRDFFRNVFRNASTIDLCISYLERRYAGRSHLGALADMNVLLLSWWEPYGMTVDEQPWPAEVVEPPGPVSPVVVQARFAGPRAVATEDGAELQVGLSRFYWMSEIRTNPDRVWREMDSDVRAGYDYARVLFQVGSLDANDYWAGHVADQNWPDHSELSARLCDEAGARGLRILATLIGKGNGLDRQAARRDYVRRMGQVLKGRASVLLAEIMNEPDAGGYITGNELLELERIFRNETDEKILTATGAVWSPGGATMFDPMMWRTTQGQVGICHLDRDQSKSEMIDRPWRQSWDVGLEGKPWVDNEHIGPGASVATESRATVLRSHRAVAFMGRAFGTCYHADPGIRGIGDLASTPGYLECPHAKRFLPGDLVNGRQQNANMNYPDRHWDLDLEFLRAENGNRRGIVRAYGVNHDGAQYTIPFGPVSDFELRSTRALRVKCFQQDINDLLWERDVERGERVRFNDEHPDYLLVSTER